LTLKLRRTRVLPTMCFPKATFSMLRSFHRIFPNLMRNLMHTCSSSLLSSKYTKLTMEQHTLVLGKTLLNNHECYSPTTYEMTRQTLYIMVDVHASSCSISLWSVQKPFDYTTYFLSLVQRTSLNVFFRMTAIKGM
jgi:hypothetical protein